MNEQKCPYRHDLPAMPERIRRLPIARSMPVPWFVAKVNGEYDFRVADPGKFRDAVRLNLCWVCGSPLGRFKTFAIGPMCAINRISSEPPSHLDCAVFSVQACPFLNLTEKERRTNNLPDNQPAAGGIAILRNPGVTLLWTTLKYHIVRAPNGILFDVGRPHALQWWSRGRRAKRAEIEESIRTGLPFLRELAEKDGPEAIKMLEAQTKEAMTLLPA